MAKVGFELFIPLPLPLEFWDYQHTITPSSCVLNFLKTQFILLQNRFQTLKSVLSLAGFPSLHCKNYIYFYDRIIVYFWLDWNLLLDQDCLGFKEIYLLLTTGQHLFLSFIFFKFLIMMGYLEKDSSKDRVAWACPC